MSSNWRSHLVGLCVVLPLFVVGAIGSGGCAMETGEDPGFDDGSGDLTAGTTQSGLWQSQTVWYCFERPLLGNMPSSVRSRVGTQADLDGRWGRRKQEFIGAINATWQSVGVLNLVPASSCQSGMLVVHYNRDTPTGGYAGIGRNGGLSVGIEMDAEFLGETYGWGSNTYHTFVAAHEFGHILGFRHEQDRTDSTCHESQDFSGTGILLTGYDSNSIMNYCARQVTGLTNLDREGYRRAYAFLADPDRGSCSDNSQYCGAWADRGECSANPGYMLPNCCQSCNAAAPRVVSRESGKCMDVAARGTENGTNIQLWECNGTGAQAFILREVRSGVFNLVNTNSQKCVDARFSGTTNGTNIQLWNCNGTNAQAFTISRSPAGYSFLRNVNSGLCVDVSAHGTANGTNIFLWQCNGAANQEWSIER